MIFWVFFSQRIGLKFTLDLDTLIIHALNEDEKTEIKKNLQQTMYNILEEKLENNVHDVTFKKVTDNHLLYAGTIHSKNIHVAI